MSNLRRALLSMLVACLLFVGCGIYINGYYLPDKPCRPVMYPSGEPTGKGRIDNVFGDSLAQVAAFYDQRLQPTTQKNSIRQWRITDRRLDLVAYACSAGDINWLTGEQGCIYLLPVAGGTRIVTELNVYEGSTVPCQGP